MNHNEKNVEVTPVAEPEKELESPKQLNHRYHRYMRANEYVAYGAKAAGANMPAKRVFQTDLALSKEVREELSKRFPDIFFVSVSSKAHDHPIAHISAQICGDIITEDIPPGSLVLDINGNPTSNERFNNIQRRKNKVNPTQIHTLVNIETPADAVRARTKWGKKIVDGRVRYEEGSLSDVFRNPQNVKKYKKYDVFLLNHTLYYFDYSEICDLLNKVNNEAILIATMVKHDHNSRGGTLHFGEQSWEQTGVVVNGWPEIKQTNVRTGEYYKHTTSDRWFARFSFAQKCQGAAERSAIAWTVREIVPETFKFTITSCPARLVPGENHSGGDLDACMEGKSGNLGRVSLTSQGSITVADDKDSIMRRTGIAVFTKDDGDKFEVQVSNVDLYNKCRTYISGKARSPATWDDLNRFAKRMCQPGQLYNGAAQIDIDAKALNDIVTASFYADVGSETQNFSKLVTDRGALKIHQNVKKGHGMVVNDVASIFKNVVKAVLVVEDVRVNKRPVHAAFSILENSESF